jgi:hypothetical protein
MGSVAERKATPTRSSSSRRPTRTLSRLKKILAALAATRDGLGNPPATP